MKYLRQFEYFDWNAFAKEMEFMTISLAPLLDFNTKEVQGTKLGIAIIKDGTSYDQKEGEQGSNLFEKITVKIPKQIDVPMNVKVQLKNVLCNVYGDYRNQLSVYAEDIIVIGK